MDNHPEVVEFLSSPYRPQLSYTDWKQIQTHGLLVLPAYNNDDNQLALLSTEKLAADVVDRVTSPTPVTPTLASESRELTTVNDNVVDIVVTTLADDVDNNEVETADDDDMLMADDDLRPVAAAESTVSVHVESSGIQDPAASASSPTGYAANSLQESEDSEVQGEHAWQESEESRVQGELARQEGKDSKVQG